MGGCLNKPEMVAGVISVDLSYHGKKDGCGNIHFSTNLIKEIRFVLFSYTRISYPFCEKAMGNNLNKVEKKLFNESPELSGVGFVKLNTLDGTFFQSQLKASPS